MRIKNQDFAQRLWDTVADVFTPNLFVLLYTAGIFAHIAGRKRIRLSDLVYALLLSPNSVQPLIFSKIDREQANKILKKVDPRLYTKTIKEAQEKQPDRIGQYIVNKLLESDKRVLISNMKISQEVKDVLNLAVRLARHSGAYYVGTEHVLAAVLTYAYDQKLEKYADLLKAFEPLKPTIMEILDSHKKFIEEAKKAVEYNKKTPISRAIGHVDPYASEEQDFLERYTIDIQDYIKNMYGLPAPIVLRKDYVHKMLATFASSVNNSVLLVGPTGAGKKHLVYGLGIWLAQNKFDIPVLEGADFKQLKVLNLPEIVSTARFGSDVERRVLGVLNQAHGKKDVLVYIGNLYDFVAPQVRGGLNMSSVLKEFVKNSHVNILATLDAADVAGVEEYAPDLMAAFDKIHVEPADKKLTKRILRAHYDYIHDKIIKLDQEDESSLFTPSIFSSKKVKKMTREGPGNIDVDTLLELVYMLAHDYIIEGVEPSKSLKVLRGSIADALFQDKDLFTNFTNMLHNIQFYSKQAAEFAERGQHKIAEKYYQKLLELENQFEFLRDTRDLFVLFGPENVYRYVADLTKLPVGMLSKAQRSALRQLESKLKEYIVSQDEAVKQVAYAVKRGRLGLVQGERPWASFIFIGPTGVGKTELAKALARVLFGDEKDHFIQLDMSEFMERHSVSKLIGSPPGYVGYDEGGYLTERIKQTPYAVVLFDEIEKASKDVLNILLQILEEGRLTDSKGESVSFKHTIIILTSNIGTDMLYGERIKGFAPEVVQKEIKREQVHEILTKQLKRSLRPELINRLDDIIVFYPLTRANAAKILDMLIERLQKHLASRGFKLEVTKRAKRQLLKLGFSQEYGARALRRVLQKYVETALADYLLEKDTGDLLGLGVFTYDADRLEQDDSKSSKPGRKRGKKSSSGALGSGASGSGASGGGASGSGAKDSKFEVVVLDFLPKEEKFVVTSLQDEGKVRV